MSFDCEGRSRGSRNRVWGLNILVECKDYCRNPVSGRGAIVLWIAWKKEEAIAHFY
ncbi:MAG: hypothetical protein ACRC62_09640 [Microcoleus sp.]